MVFSGLTFLYLFLPGTLLLCFAMPARLRNAVLLTASLFFYFYAEQGDLLLMPAVILLSWAAGLPPARSGWPESEEPPCKAFFALQGGLFDFGTRVRPAAGPASPGRNSRSPPRCGR